MEFIAIARLWVLICLIFLFCGVFDLWVFSNKNKEFFMIKNSQNTNEAWLAKKKAVIILYQRKRLSLFFVLVVQVTGFCFLHYYFEGGIKWLIATLLFALSWPLVLWLQKKH